MKLRNNRYLRETSEMKPFYSDLNRVYFGFARVGSKTCIFVFTRLGSKRWIFGLAQFGSIRVYLVSRVSDLNRVYFVLSEKNSHISNTC